MENYFTYEKHQRDYSALATSVVFEDLVSKRLEYFFGCPMNQIYILIENGILYRYVAEEDHKNRTLSWLNNNNLLNLQQIVEKADNELENFTKFMASDHNDLKKDLLQIHDYLRLYTPIILVVSYVPMYSKEEELNDLCMHYRKKYEPVHRGLVELELKLLNKLEQENGLSHNSIANLTSQEFIHFTKTNELPADIEKRNIFSVYKFFDGQESVDCGEKGLSWLKEISYNFDKSTSDIKGQVAYKGIAKGKVRILRFIKDGDDFKEGEILVASMTDPRYLPAMKKAAAIVTDEGGITCHAAIVARELKKPCVIGTKFATEILKDGDLVEVDAENGIVKKL